MTSSQTNSIEDSQRFRVNADVLSQQLNGESVLLNLTTEKYFGLDEIGSLVWAYVRDGNTLEQMIGNLSVEYQVDELELRNDVVTLLHSFLEERLIALES
jgi:Coenzyme PQQ synthesis protein D (PqqD)